MAIEYGKVLKDDNWQALYEKFIQTTKNYEVNELLGYKKNIDEKTFAIGEKEHPMQGMMLFIGYCLIMDL